LFGHGTNASRFAEDIQTAQGVSRKRDLMGERTRSVVFLHPSDEMYGADRVLLEIVAALPDIEPEVWLPTDVHYAQRALSRELERHGVTVQHRGLPVLRRSLGVRAIPRIIRQMLLCAVAMFRRRPVVVYLNTSAMLLLAPIARLTGAQVVLHLHEHWGRKEGAVLGLLARSCTRIVCVSDAVRRCLPEALQSRSQVIYNGFSFEAPVVGARPSSEPLTFVLASRWNSWKGQESLLEAWDQVDGPGERRLIVLGGPPLSGQAFDLPSYVGRMRRRDSVQVIGEVPDVRPYLRDCDVVLVPSVRPDPLPTIAIEAAAAGRAVLASDIGGLPEIVADGMTGRLLPPGDSPAWAQAISTMTREAAEDLGARARERYESAFQPERFSESIRLVVESMFSESG
jgi:glycosyltransferase involved in cell wall biosynthesis